MGGASWPCSLWNADGERSVARIYTPFMLVGQFEAKTFGVAELNAALFL